MERCYNCRKEAIALICSTCDVGVCMWCFSFHFNHQLKNTQDYLRELLAAKQVDLALHFKLTAKATDMKAALEASIRSCKDSREAERVRRQAEELRKYTNEVMATSEYFEMLANTVESATIEYPMTFVEKIRNIKVEINVPEYLNDFKEVRINCSDEDEKHSFREHIEAKVEELMGEMKERARLIFVEVEASLNVGMHVHIPDLIAQVESFCNKKKEEFVATVDYELASPLYPNAAPCKENLKSLDESERLAQEIAANQARIANEMKIGNEKIAAMNGEFKRLVQEMDSYKASKQREIQELESTRQKLLAENDKIAMNSFELTKKLQLLKDELLNAESNCNAMQTKYSSLADKVNRESKRLETLVKETRAQESKCNEARSLHEYKQITTQKINALTESLRRCGERTLKLRNELEGVKGKVTDIGNFAKKFASFFHKRRNALHKAVQQTVMDLQMAHVKRLQQVKANSLYNKNYRGRLQAILAKTKAAIREMKQRFADFKRTASVKEASHQILNSAKPLRVFLNDTAVLAKSLRSLCKSPEVEAADTPIKSKLLKNVYKAASTSMRELMLAANNGNKQIQEMEGKRERVKKKVEALLRSGEEGWDLCDAKETNMKEEIVEVIKNYFQIK